jgi:hypothetical protein
MWALVLVTESIAAEANRGHCGFSPDLPDGPDDNPTQHGKQPHQFPGNAQGRREVYWRGHVGKNSDRLLEPMTVRNGLSR